jgi:hypothetical protein
MCDTACMWLNPLPPFHATCAQCCTRVRQMRVLDTMSRGETVNRKQPLAARGASDLHQCSFMSLVQGYATPPPTHTTNSLTHLLHRPT